ncbi:hypothetical protein BJ508DRAFT_419857 [Ascobolus immersus RN42]|uniref:Cell wall mannoprotein PIR1-like C-terminal domain-containing protein n=1 Tax=Ascobolus immersus RN42 TaxID=1160509 RepID=A0A3N4HAT4_ASCIM|nr:hypothetical protein BJ508DRAFT_419857 [Ascobolus immersus RN42]
MFSSIINTAIPFALFAVLASAAVPQGVDPYTLPRNEVHLQLKDGKLIDQEGRTGYIASNHQFQFDDPPQHGFLIDRGFSLCDDGRLALNGSQEFWRCKSSNCRNSQTQST